MADDKELAKAVFDSAIEQAGRLGHGATFIGISGSLAVTTSATARVITDITPAAATAQIEIAKMTHAIPAQEQTRQEAERTKQARQPTWRVALCVLGLGLGLVTMAIRPQVAKYAAAAVGVLAGGFGTAEIVSRWRDKAGAAPSPKAGTDSI